MNLLCWNCHRLGNPQTKQELGDLIQVYDPSIVFLLETWLQKARLEVLCARFKFGGMLNFSRERRGGGNGVWLFFGRKILITRSILILLII